MNSLRRFGCLVFVLAAVLRCETESSTPLDLDDPALRMATIEGFVTNGDSRISGAKVSLTGPGVTRSVSSDSSGFTFADLPAGLYTLAATFSGFACQPATAEMIAGQTVTMSIACTEQLGAIRGTVTADASPISGVLVPLRGRSATTDSDGVFAFDSVRVGTYTITMTASGADCRPVTVTVEVDQRATADIVCRPFGGLRVIVHQKEWPDLLWAFRVYVTGSASLTRDGILGSLVSFEFTDLPPGDYVVAAGVASESLYCESAIATVRMARGATVDINCTFRPTGVRSISGRVTINGAGRGVVPVELRDPSRTLLRGLATTVSFESGNYEFRNVAPDGYAVIMTPPAGALCNDTEKDVTVRENQETIVNFTCTSKTTGSIAGFVDSENYHDSQLAGRSVTVTGPADRESTTGPWNGVYAFDDLPPGNYVVASWCGLSVNVNVQAGKTATANMLC